MSIIFQALLWCFSCYFLAKTVFSHLKIFSKSSNYKAFILTLAMALPLAFLAHGFFGDASLSFPVLAFIALKRPNYNSLSKIYFFSSASLWLLLSASSMGILWPDLYDSGYYPISIATFVFIIFSVFSLNLSIWLSLSILANGVLGTSNFLFSTNVWDFVVDSPSAILSIFLLIRSSNKAFA